MQALSFASFTAARRMGFVFLKLGKIIPNVGSQLLHNLLYSVLTVQYEPSPTLTNSTPSSLAEGRQY